MVTPYTPPAFLTALPSGIWSGDIFPYLPGQAIDVQKEPLFSSGVKRAVSGRERRRAYWSYPLWQFTVKFEVLRQGPTLDELAILWEFFNNQQGMFSPWLFVDPDDNQVTGASFGTGDGATTDFQLKRQIRTWTEPVYACYSPTIYKNGVTMTLGTDYTILNNNTIHFAVAPANTLALTWDGYFYFGCRFLQDKLTATKIVQSLWSGGGLQFTSIKS